MPFPTFSRNSLPWLVTGIPCGDIFKVVVMEHAKFFTNATRFRFYKPSIAVTCHLKFNDEPK